jgi:preprotein translocase subunit SecG
MTFFTQLRIFVEFKGGNNRASVITSGIAGFFNGLFSSIALNLTVSTWIGALYMIVLSLVLVIYVFYVSYYINKLQTVEEEGIH